VLVRNIWTPVTRVYSRIINLGVTNGLGMVLKNARPNTDHDTPASRGFLQLTYWTYFS
jgi:hypothetical protein